MPSSMKCVVFAVLLCALVASVGAIWSPKVDGVHTVFQRFRHLSNPDPSDAATPNPRKMFGSLADDHPLNTRRYRPEAFNPPTYDTQGRPGQTVRLVTGEQFFPQGAGWGNNPSNGGWAGHPNGAGGNQGAWGSGNNNHGEQGNQGNQGNNGGGNGGQNHQGQSDHDVAAYYRQLEINNTRTINGALALYATALYDKCGPYVLSLRGTPANISAVLDTVVAPTAQGRIHPLGYFDSPEVMVEYFMLACLGGNAVLHEEFSNVIAFNNQVWFQVNFWMGTAANPTEYIFNLTHTGWAKVNAEGKVCALKVQFQRLGIQDVPAPSVSGSGAQQGPNAADFIAGQAAEHAELCQAVQELCVGPNQQFTSVAACQTWYDENLTNSGLERGDQVETGCKGIHLALCAITPNIHCPHVGPSTDPVYDPMCTPHDPITWYQTDVALENLPC